MLNKKELFKLLSSRFENDECKKLCDLPLPATLHGAVKGARRIKEAIKAGEKIAIVGDYDVDGVVSSVIVSEFLEKINANFLVKIPNRFKDGYGLNEKIVEELANEDIRLIITVDNGILAFDAAKRAKELGICLIISDHHNPGKELPDAYAVINPKQDKCDFSELDICGAQVAWYLLAALKSELGLDFNLACFFELLALAIIADMMELRDLNRLLVKKGLEMINNSFRPCFLALKASFEKDEFSYDDIGFLIAPLINSAGRMKDAILAYDFLRAKNQAKADLLLQKLIACNKLRKECEQELVLRVSKEVKKDDLCILVAGEGWHEGVLGIVASRLSKLYNKPSFVLSIKNDKAKGSGRSVGDIDILELLRGSREYLLEFGGHKGAVGLSLKTKNLQKLKSSLNQALEGIEPAKEELNVVGELGAYELDWELVDILEYFEPFGYKNPKPLFKFSSYLIKDILLMGKDKAHVRLSIEKDGLNFIAIFFNHDRSFKKNSYINFIASISKNVYKGNSSLQLLIKEIL